MNKRARLGGTIFLPLVFEVVKLNKTTQTEKNRAISPPLFPFGLNDFSTGQFVFWSVQQVQSEGVNEASKESKQGRM